MFISSLWLETSFFFFLLIHDFLRLQIIHIVEIHEFYLFLLSTIY
jgi:hypothetical protein